MNIIRISETRIAPPYTANTAFAMVGDAGKYFKGDVFNVRYSVDITGIPYGIAVIPFVCNVLPIIWLTDSKLVLDEIDKEFFHSIDEFKRGYEEMYPNLKFRGKIECKKIVRHEPITKERKSLVFFSGGVDAFATLFAHIDESPTLFTLCGADIELSNTDGWTQVQKQIEDVCDEFHLPAIQCYSNFRECIDEEALCALIAELGVIDDWWHGFQHGIGLIGHAAVLTYLYGYTKCYIASSYTIRDRPYQTCASDPRIDNHVHFCGADVYHDQFEYNRQQKIEHIVEYCKAHHHSVFLRVCWEGTSGGNCGRCEKCIRTICGLLTEGVEPKQYGFDDVSVWRIKMMLKYKLVVPDFVIPLWEDIQCALREKPKGKTRIEWLRDMDLKWLKKNKIKTLVRLVSRKLKCLE